MESSHNHQEYINYHSYAKINLFLDVISRYKNGYHGIRSLFAEISLHDIITVQPNELGQIRVIDKMKLLPAENLLVKAAKVYRQFLLKPITGIDFTIEKQIPIGGGLGGGSSNAACVLKILNQYWNIRYGRKKLKKIAFQLGADVPFFIDGGVQAVYGIGQLTRRIHTPLTCLNLLLIIPELGVSTIEAYRQLDEADGVRDEYENKKKFIALTEAVRNNVYDAIIKNIYNKFESVVFVQYPILKKIKNHILAVGADSAFMSGSGSTIVGIFRTEQKMHNAFDKLTVAGYRVIKTKIQFNS